MYMQEVSWQDLCKRPLGKISATKSVQGLCTSSLKEVSWQDLCTSKTSLVKISARTLYKRPPCQDLRTRSPWLNETSTAPQRERSDTRKVPRGLREQSQNQATTRAIRHAQSDEEVARAHVRDSQNIARAARTMKKWTSKMSTSQQRRLPIGLSHFYVEVYKGPRLPRKTSPRHSKSHTTRNHHVRNQNWRQFHKTILFSDLSKRCPTKYRACHETWPPKPPLMLTHACEHFSNVQKVPRLPCGWESARCPLHLSRKTTFQTPYH